LEKEEMTLPAQIQAWDSAIPATLLISVNIKKEKCSHACNEDMEGGGSQNLQ
jgi:hypothetical protein